MIKAYRALTWTVVGLVLLQAASVAWGAAGESHFVDHGGVVDKALLEAAQAGGEPPFPEVFAFPIHGLNGGILIPVVAGAVLACSFAAKLVAGRKWAAILFGLVVLQGQLGYVMGDLPAIGLVHGANAMLIVLVAFHTARRPALAQSVIGVSQTASLP